MKNVLTLFFAIALSALAGETEKKAYVIGVENINYYPYYDFSEGVKRAYFTELIDAFAKAGGYTFTFKPLPVKRLYAELLESEQIDFKFPDNRLWLPELKAGHTVRYSDPIMEFTDGVMVLPENGENGIESLKVLGTIAGFSPVPYMDMITQGKVTESQNRTLKALLATTLSGRIDGAYVNVAVAKNVLQSMKLPGRLIFNKNLPYDHNAYHLSTLRHPEVLEELNRFMKKNGDWIRAVKTRYHIIETEKQ